MSSEEIWSSPQLTRDLSKRKSNLEGIVSHFEALADKLTYLEEAIGILEEESGGLFLNDLQKEIKNLREELELLEIENLLSGEMDKNNAIVAIHPGAGGTESQDWAQMLMRMYLRWAERHAFKTQVVDLQIGDAVKVTDGPFKDYEGKVGEIDEERGKVRVLISLFGRETPVELDFLQVKRI